MAHQDDFPVSISQIRTILTASAAQWGIKQYAATAEQRLLLMHSREFIHFALFTIRPLVARFELASRP